VQVQQVNAPGWKHPEIRQDPPPVARFCHASVRLPRPEKLVPARRFGFNG
jgi:hypothetical protein